jgi:hypothetical protein
MSARFNIDHDTPLLLPPDLRRNQALRRPHRQMGLDMEDGHGTVCG